jgi:hypothetical protein
MGNNEGKELELSNNAPSTETHISVPKEQLALLLQQNKKIKDENAQLLSMLHSSVEIIDFMKSNFLGGNSPKDLTIPKLIKIITRLPMKLNQLSKQDTDALAQNFEIIRLVAEQHLSENEIQKISK